MITPDKWQQLCERMQKLGISETDLDEKFILGSGSGGQKVNKTNTCVSLKHLPSGIAIKCQQSRSRESNRFFARRRLCEKLETIVLQEKSKKQQEIEKIRQQKRRRSRRLKQKILQDKRHQSQVKETRKKPPVDQ